MKLTKKQLNSINEQLKNDKTILLPEIKNDWVQLLPRLERFEFRDRNVGESVELIKNNTVRTLRFKVGPEKRYDLANLLIFKDTLEELYLDGKYYNIESVLNEMKNLKVLEAISIRIDFELIIESSIEYLCYTGSKIKNCNGIRKFNKLKVLELYSNRSLENIEFLQELKELEELMFLNCSKIKRFPNLDGLQKLKTLIVQDCNSLEDIAEVKKLENVEIHINGRMLPEKHYHNICKK
jgi:hypothetical protein